MRPRNEERLPEERILLLRNQKAETIFVLSAANLTIVPIAILIFTKKPTKRKERERMDSSSIGIIGGADGPTQIMISGNPILEIIVVAAIVAIIVGIVVILKKRK